MGLFSFKKRLTTCVKDLGFDFPDDDYEEQEDDNYNNDNTAFETSKEASPSQKQDTVHTMNKENDLEQPSDDNIEVDSEAEVESEQITFFDNTAEDENSLIQRLAQGSKIVMIPFVLLL